MAEEKPKPTFIPFEGFLPNFFTIPISEEEK